MKHALMAIVCMVAVGCDYAVPLVKTPALPIDKTVVGRWEPATTNDTESLLVLPLDPRQYLVEYPVGAKDAMFARACLCQAAGKTLVQLDWFGTAQGQQAQGKETFQFAEYLVTNDVLTVRLLNPDVVKKDAASAAELTKRIAENAGKPDCFREAMVFRRSKSVNGEQ